MTTIEVLAWIKKELSCYMTVAISEAKIKNPKLLYTEDWLAGITYRETGGLIDRYVTKGFKPADIHPLMRGDYTQRKGEVKKQYHGFGYGQIDINSFPEFVASGHWQDPLETYRMSIKVLEGKRIYISNRIILNGIEEKDYHRMITAAYNCGEGNVVKAITTRKDIDYYTTGGDYSAAVWRYRKIYRELSDKP